MSVRQLTPTKLLKRLDSAADEPLLLLDIREPSERALCLIEGSVHIPMQEIPARLSELPQDAEIVVYCHHGMRSMQVANFLDQRGYTQVSNLMGGIDAWSTEADPSVRRY